LVRWSFRYQQVVALVGDVRQAHLVWRVTLCVVCASTAA
jgi:hypothetical protein